MNDSARKSQPVNYVFAVVPNIPGRGHCITLWVTKASEILESVLCDLSSCLPRRYEHIALSQSWKLLHRLPGLRTRWIRRNAGFSPASLSSFAKLRPDWSR
jgi:hypothetical protein